MFPDDKKRAATIIISKMADPSRTKKEKDNEDPEKFEAREEIMSKAENEEGAVEDNDIGLSEAVDDMMLAAKEGNTRLFKDALEDFLEMYNVKKDMREKV